MWAIIIGVEVIWFTIMLKIFTLFSKPFNDAMTAFWT